jgi:polar amino acid transport system substrate-binding protein
MVDDTLTVCVDAPKYPFAFQDGAGAWRGSDIEIVEAVADDLDLDLAVVAVPFAGIWRAPAEGTCDLAAAAITITDGRRGEALFSAPYMDVNQSLLIRAADADERATLASQNGRRIGVKAGTTSEAYASANLPAGASLVTLPETEALFLALGAREVDGVIADLPLNGYRSTLDSEVRLTEQFPTGEQYGLAAALDNGGLIEDVDEALEGYLASNEYRNLLFRWFGLE